MGKVSNAHTNAHLAVDLNFEKLDCDEKRVSVAALAPDSRSVRSLYCGGDFINLQLLGHAGLEQSFEIVEERKK